MSANATHTTPPRGGIHPGWLVAAVVVAVAALGGLAWALLDDDGDDSAAPGPTESPGSPSPEPTPTPSPDGTPRPDGAPLVAVTDTGDLVLVDADDGLALVLRDLASGDERAIPGGFGDNPAAWIGQVAWSPDGDRLYVPRGLEGSALYAVDASAESLDGAQELGDEATERYPVTLQDGTVLVYTEPFGEPVDQAYVAALDPGGAGEARRVEALSGRYVAGMAAHPSRDAVAVLTGEPTFGAGEGPSWSMSVWTDDGDETPLGDGFVAVGW